MHVLAVFGKDATNLFSSNLCCVVGRESTSADPGMLMLNEILYNVHVQLLN